MAPLATFPTMRPAEVDQADSTAICDDSSDSDDSSEFTFERHPVIKAPHESLLTLVFSKNNSLPRVNIDCQSATIPDSHSLKPPTTLSNGSNGIKTPTKSTEGTGLSKAKAIPTSRETRNKMLSTELPVSLRLHMLRERSQNRDVVPEGQHDIETVAPRPRRYPMRDGEINPDRESYLNRTDYYEHGW